ncbi:MAG: GDSL-type esterase/lipase family protein [Ilumatobacteraceae bacterium]
MTSTAYRIKDVADRSGCGTVTLRDDASTSGCGPIATCAPEPVTIVLDAPTRRSGPVPVRAAVIRRSGAARLEQMVWERMPRRAFLVAALGMVATACSQTTRAAGGGSDVVSGASLPGGEGAVTLPAAAAPISTLGMIGDSITKLSTPDLEEVLRAQGITPTIDAEVSRRIEVGNGKSEPLNGEQVLTNLLKFGLHPDVWVFALGTNDLTAYDADGFAQRVDAMLAMTDAATPVIWVDTYRPKTMEQTKVFNEVLRQQAARRPGMKVASWFEVASANPKKLISKDQVHPTEAGQAAFAQVVADAVAALR